MMGYDYISYKYSVWVKYCISIKTIKSNLRCKTNYLACFHVLTLLWPWPLVTFFVCLLESSMYDDHILNKIYFSIYLCLIDIRHVQRLVRTNKWRPSWMLSWLPWIPPGCQMSTLTKNKLETSPRHYPTKKRSGQKMHTNNSRDCTVCCKSNQVGYFPV